MNDDEVLEQVNKKNTVAVEQALRDLTKQCNSLIVDVRKLHELYGDTFNKLAEIEQKLNFHIAFTTGTGPTEK